jgi:hypothetical protein
MNNNISGHGNEPVAFIRVARLTCTSTQTSDIRHPHPQAQIALPRGQSRTLFNRWGYGIHGTSPYD